MPLKFCANLSFMFKESSILRERYALAAQAGFKGVECGFPYSDNLEDLVSARKESNLEQVLINVFVGDTTKGEFGFCAIPGKETEFKKSIDQAVKYAKGLQCGRIHIMSGLVEHPTEKNDTTYLANLRYATELFEKENILGLIEPINKYSVPKYYMNSFEKALHVVQQINSSHLRILLDVFHLQQISGNLTRNIKMLMPYVGHVQIAQVPDRHEPDTAGEIDYHYILSLLDQLKYDGWIGLEYNPLESSAGGLKWIKNFNYSL